MSDLDELKELLFGAEKQALDSIAQRVESRDIRSADVADVLSEAIHQSYKKGDELVDSMKEPVGECVQLGLREDPETYSDALYPIMGPAIRKAITHALKSFSEQINQALEHSVSPKGLKWRMEATRAGIPFGEYVVQRTLLYRVEQAYLISRDNGLLMGHVHHAASKIKDSDAVSAMFTAIQDFVKESFSPDRTGRLEAADMGEFTLWAVHGPHALLVCVIRGVPPRSLRSDLSAILERIHFRYGDAIRQYKGNTASVPEVEAELERCLRFEAKQDDSDKQEAGTNAGRRRVIPIVLLVLIVAAAIYFGVKNWNAGQKLEALDAALAGTPGIYVAEIERNGETFVVRGLKDPLAAEVTDIAASVKIAPEHLRVTMQPFQSLEPEILVARSQRVLGRPGNVHYDVTGSTLVVSGDAPWTWRQQLESKYANVSGIDSLDASGLTSNDRAQFVETVRGLDGQYFYFERGIKLAPGNTDALAAYGSKLQQVARDAGKFDFAVQVELIGSTDNIGDTTSNARLAIARATAVSDALTLHGIEIRELRSKSAPDAKELPDGTNLRNVKVQLKLVPAMPTS